MLFIIVLIFVWKFHAWMQSFDHTQSPYFYFYSSSPPYITRNSKTSVWQCHAYTSCILFTLNSLSVMLLLCSPIPSHLQVAMYYLTAMPFSLGFVLLCYTLSLTRTTQVDMDEKLLVWACVTLQWSHHWKQWPLSSSLQLTTVLGSLCTLFKVCICVHSLQMV